VAELLALLSGAPLPVLPPPPPLQLPVPIIDTAALEAEIDALRRRVDKLRGNTVDQRSRYALSALTCPDHGLPSPSGNGNGAPHHSGPCPTRPCPRRCRC
jgi:hypothetical protein